MRLSTEYQTRTLINSVLLRLHVGHGHSCTNIKIYRYITRKKKGNKEVEGELINFINWLSFN